MKILNTLSSTFFAKRGWMHFTGTIAILYKISIWFGWNEFTLESKIIGCTIASIIIGIVINSVIEYVEETLVRKKLNQPYADVWEWSDVCYGALGAPVGAWIGIANQNLALAAYLILGFLTLLEIIRISKTK